MGSRGNSRSEFRLIPEQLGSMGIVSACRKAGAQPPQLAWQGGLRVIKNHRVCLVLSCQLCWREKRAMLVVFNKSFNPTGNFLLQLKT